MASYDSDEHCKNPTIFVMTSRELQKMNLSLSRPPYKKSRRSPRRRSVVRR